MKRAAETSGHLHDFMDAISHQPSQWEDLEHCHMNHYFWGKFGTYLGQHAKNKTMVKFPWGNKTTSKKDDMSRKLARTTTSIKDGSQIRSTFGSAESTHDKTKEVVYSGEFINFQVMFLHKYYASNNTLFLAYLLCF